MDLLSLGLILLGGLTAGYLSEKIKLPKIVGMIIIGILLGPSVFNIIDNSIINISAMLRQIALVIILTRSGLSLDFKKLKEIGISAILMSFIPAVFEIIGMLIFGTLLLNLTVIESLLLGTVVAAVSPAILVPRMIKLKELKYGSNKNVPELVMAGSSADDIFVIILFYSFLGLAKNNIFEISSLLQIPISIILGIILGVLVGLIISFIFKKYVFNNIAIVIILLSTSFLMIGLEEILKNYINLSALLGIVTMGMIISFKNKELSNSTESDYKKLWGVFEVLLFVLVGISVNLEFAASAGLMPLFVLFLSLIFRMAGVLIALIFSNLNYREKIFVMFSYIPKATVQASIGGIALSLGLPSGSLILTMAVLSILITAPLGAILIDKSYDKLLIKE